MYGGSSHGFLEIVYKDALELLFRQANILYEREREYNILFRNENFWQ